jgi:hypothetical protein
MTEFSAIKVYDPRIYLALALGGLLMFVCSQRGVAAWPLWSKAKVEIVTLVLTILLLRSHSSSVRSFQLPVLILALISLAGFCFVLVLSLRLIRFRSCFLTRLRPVWMTKSNKVRKMEAERWFDGKINDNYAASWRRAHL